MYRACIDCACCNVEEMKCYPNDRDCESEYDLTEEDLATLVRCDFFIPKKQVERKIYKGE